MKNNGFLLLFKEIYSTACERSSGEMPGVMQALKDTAYLLGDTGAIFDESFVKKYQEVAHKIWVDAKERDWYIDRYLAYISEVRAKLTGNTSSNGNEQN